jgi:methyl-accepting chemotaxis protein
VTLLMLCIVGGFAVFQASNIYDGTRQLADDWLPSVQSLGKIQALASDARRTTLRAVLATDPKDRDE